MTGRRYLDYETVVEINAEHGGDGAGVRDENGLRAAVGRPEATFMGEDLYPTVIRKAAALLHGLSTTQYFHDGNKRTAWVATRLFLALNDSPLRKVPDIEAEMLVLAIATKAFESDEGPEHALRKAGEWFESVQLRMSDRLDYAIIARSADVFDHGFSAEGAQLGGLVLSGFPEIVPLTAIVRTQFLLADAYRDWNLTARIIAPTDCAEIVAPSEQVLNYLEAHDEMPEWFDVERDTVPHADSIMLAFEDLQNRHESGVIPSLTVLGMALLVRGPGRAHLIFEINGEFLARRLLEIASAPELGQLQNVDEHLARLLGEG